MIPFQREAFLTILLETKEKVNKGSNPQFDINHEDIRDR